MIFQEVIPCEPLRPFVDNFLLMRYDRLEGANPVKPYPTRIEQALVFFARGGIRAYDVHTKQYARIAHNALFGQQVSRLDFHPQPDVDFLMLMVVFRPGALHRLLGMPSSELTCAFIDAESLLASELQRVNDRIANATSYREMVSIAETYLLGKCSAVRIDDHPIDRIAQLLIDDPLKFSLDWFATQANLSTRQFQRKFQDRIGVSPKFYSRISRFSKAFHFKNANPDTDWLTIAMRYGYTDYYHLSKEFKQFANTTPNILVDEYAHRVEAGATWEMLEL